MGVHRPFLSATKKLPDMTLGSSNRGLYESHTDPQTDSSVSVLSIVAGETGVDSDQFALRQRGLETGIRVEQTATEALATAKSRAAASGDRRLAEARTSEQNEVQRQLKFEERGVWLNRINVYLWLGLAGICFGVAVHLRIYPILYVVPLFFGGLRRIGHFLSFGAVSGGMFIGLGYCCYALYGDEFVENCYLYHMTERADTKY